MGKYQLSFKKKKGGTFLLIIAHSVREIRFRELMCVYAEANAENGHAEWPSLPLAFAREMAEQSFFQYLKEVFFPTPGAFYALWEEDGHYVSALRMEPYRDGLLLAGLETAPEARKHGYAKQLIQGVLKMLAQGDHIPVYSHVHKKNLPSRNLHEKCGFRICKDHAVYIDGSVSHRAFTYSY